MHHDVNTELKFNPSELARLTRLAMHSQNIADFAKTADLSRTIISQALNCSLKNVPTIRTLCKIAAASEGRVTVKQLFLACGYPGDNRAVSKTLSIPSWLNDMAIEKGINFSQILQKALKEELGIIDKS